MKVTLKAWSTGQSRDVWAGLPHPTESDRHSEVTPRGLKHGEQAPWDVNVHHPYVKGMRTGYHNYTTLTMGNFELTATDSQ